TSHRLRLRRAVLVVAGIGGYIGNRIGQLLDDRD
ncbi:hypothetical protein PSYMO_38343, partial [Pseudomonas amygdali pv. mori str. 301020]